MEQLTKVFAYGNAEVRTVMVGGDPWFVLKDVCDVLDLRSPDVRRRLNDDVVSTHTVEDSRGRANTASVVNEDGLYDVILESRKPEARGFRKWITSEVLPTIRKTGGYVSNDDLFVQTYLPHADASTQLLFRATLETVRTQNETIAIMKPKADKYDEFLDSDGLTTMTIVGKQFLGGMSAQKVGEFLRDHNVLYKKKIDGVFPPRQGYTEYFRIHMVPKHGEMRRSVKVTAEGIDFIIELSRKDRQHHA